MRNGESVESEYKSLREELIRNSTRIGEWTKLSLVVTVALLGYAMGSPGASGPHGAEGGFAWAVALLPIWVTFPLVILSLNHKFQITRIATYLRVQFQETHPYEAHLWSFRQRDKFPHPSFEFGSWGTVLVVGIASLVVSRMLPGWSWDLAGQDGVRTWVTVVSGVSWLAFLVWVLLVSRKLKMGGDLEQSMANEWSEVVDST